MEISKLLQLLSPNLEKRQILDECESAEKAIRSCAMPAYDEAVRLQKGFKFKSTQYGTIEAAYQRLCNDRGSMVTGIERALKNALANIEAVKVMIDDLFGDETVTSALTYRKGNILQFVEAAGFVGRYAHRLLSYLYTAETAQFADGGVKDVSEVYSPAELEWFEVNQSNFFIALQAVGKEHNSLRKEIEAIPEITIVPEAAKSTQATFGKKLDPLGFGFIPVKLNPFWYIGKAIAEYQVYRYNQMKQELTLMRLKVLNLQRMQAAKPDARIQKEIREYESIVGDLSYKLAKLEKEYA